MSSDARAAASPLLSARVATGQNADDSVLEWTLGRLSLPPPSPAPSSFSVAGEQMHLDDLLSTSGRGSATSPPHSTKKEDDEAERLRLEALKAHVPSCLSNVLSVAPAAVTALSKLNLSFNRLESVDSAFVLQALPLLQNLDLSNNRIHDIAQIQELGQHAALTCLDLSCNPLQNSGQRVLLLQALIFSNPLKPLSSMDEEELTAITCGGKTASFSNILSSERAGSIIIKGIHPSKHRPSTAKAKFSKQIMYSDMNPAAVPRPCAFPQLKVLNGTPLTVDIVDLAALSELEMLSARQSNLRTELPRRHAAAVAAQTKEKWLEFDPDVKDIMIQQAHGTTYQKQFPLLLHKTGSRFKKYAHRDLNRRVKHFIQSGDLRFTLYDSDNDTEDETGGIKPLQGAAAIKTDSSESRDLLDDLGTVQWTKASVRSSSPEAFAGSTFHASDKTKTAAESRGRQEADGNNNSMIEDQEALLNFSATLKASATISSILARVSANRVVVRDHANNGQLPVAVDLNDDAQAVLKASIDAKAASTTMFSDDSKHAISNADSDDASDSKSPACSPGVKSLKKSVQPKSSGPGEAPGVKAPTDERNVWVYEPALRSMDSAAVARQAAVARAAALSVKLVDAGVGEEETTVVTVRLPDQKSASFKAMRSARLGQLHAAAAAAFCIESEFFFSLSYPKKLLLQLSVTLEELGLAPSGLLLVVFADERDTVRTSGDQVAAESKVCLGNILEMELKEQQTITKSVHSHILSRHPKVSNLINDATSKKDKSTAPSTSSGGGDDEVAAALTAVDGLFLKTNVELQTISNSSRAELPVDAMKKMVKIEAAQEQRVLNREHEKLQYQQHVKRLDAISDGASRSAVHRASTALLYKTAQSNQAGSKVEPPAPNHEARATSKASLSPRKRHGAAAASARPSSGAAGRPVVGFEFYRSSMDTVEDIQRNSSGIARDKYVETLMGCVDARHAAKTEPKLLSRYLDRFVAQELKYEDNRRNNSENLDYLIQAHSFGRENSVAIDSSGKRVKYPERLRSVAAADEAQLTQARAALRVPVHARLPTAALKLPVKETSQRRIDFKRSC